MYLIIFIIIAVSLSLLFLRRERLDTLDVSSGPVIMSQYTRRQYEEKFANLENEAREILDPMEKSEAGKIIKQRRVDKYGLKFETAKKDLADFEEKYKNQIVDITYTREVFGRTMTFTKKEIKDPVLNAKWVELKKQVEDLNNELNKPFTIDEGISIENEYILESITGQSGGFNFTFPKLQKIKDNIGSIPEILKKDDMVRMEMARKGEEEARLRELETQKISEELKKKSESRESPGARLRRERRERSLARAQALEAAASIQRKPTGTGTTPGTTPIMRTGPVARVASTSVSRTIATVPTTTPSSLVRDDQNALIAAAKQTESIMNAEKVEISKEELMKIQSAREEAESVLAQLSEIPLEERISRKIFVQPKLDHKPYPYVRSQPARKPYDTTKYKPNENLFKSSEISSIFPRPKL